MRQVKTIVLATTNSNKISEIQNIFKIIAPDLQILSASDVIRNADKLDTLEKFNTYEENSAAKARGLSMSCHYPVLADDSGLECLGLDGKPGVHSKRFATPKIGQSQDSANVAKLLESLSGQSKEAKMICCMTLCIEGIILQGRGEITGTIAPSSIGSHGFGYDSIFIPTGTQLSFAELSAEQKNSISHRRIAIEQIIKEVQRLGIQFVKP